MSATDLIGRVAETIAAFLALGCERFEAAGAKFHRNMATPTRYDANTVTLIRDPSSIGELLQRADVEYAHLEYRNFHVLPLAPPQVAAKLALAGFGRWSSYLVMILEGPLNAIAKPCDIRQVMSDADWERYYELAVMNVREDTERTGNPRPSEAVMRELSTYVRGKTGAPTWMAYVDDLACAYLTSWAGENGVGQVEDLFTHPGYRHRGLATALIAHGVAHAREQGAGPIAIIADPTDTPMNMYAAMGFRPLFISRSQYR